LQEHHLYRLPLHLAHLNNQLTGFERHKPTQFWTVSDGSTTDSRRPQLLYIFWATCHGVSDGGGWHWCCYMYTWTSTQSTLVPVLSWPADNCSSVFYVSTAWRSNRRLFLQHTLKPPLP